MASKNSFSSLDGLRGLSVAPGSVFLGPWAGVDHEKFLIVAGVDKDRILVCSVMINSQINQYIMKRPKILACQVELKGSDYDFLSHDSYANCAQPIKAKSELFMVDDLKYCGLLKDKDLLQIQQQVISSGSLTNDEIATFFGNGIEQFFESPFFLVTPSGVDLLGKGTSKGTSKETLRVLTLLHGEMSIRELMEVLHFSSRDKFLANYLTPAIVGGFIEMTQPNSPKSPTQKYRLTALGKELQRLNS